MIENSTTPPESESQESTPVKRGPWNRAAIKRHLLALSEKLKGGKFTRVSEETLTAIEAIAENKHRELYSVQFRPVGAYDVVLPTEDFLTGDGKDKLAEAFNIWLAREMQRRVNDTRTGKTI